MQAILGQEPPTHRRSTTAVLCPDCARCQAMSLPPVPLPRISASYRSGPDMSFSVSRRLSGTFGMRNFDPMYLGLFWKNTIYGLAVQPEKMSCDSETFADCCRGQSAQVLL